MSEGKQHRAQKRTHNLKPYDIELRNQWVLTPLIFTNPNTVRESYLKVKLYCQEIVISKV